MQDNPPFLTREMLNFDQGVPFSLRITVVADTAGPVVVRGFTKSSLIHRIITPTSDGINTSVRINLDDIPIMIGIFDTDDQHKSGGCWGSIILEISGERVGELCSGFIGREKAISWPATNSLDLIPNRGHFVTVSSPNPAAGAEIALTVPAGEIWLVHAASVVLVTDANAADRRVHFRFATSDGVNTLTFNDINQIASTTRNYTLAPFGALPATSDDDDILIPLPSELWLDQLSTITTETVNIQAADDFASMRLRVEKFFDRDE